MAQKNNLFTDNEYRLMTEISENENITQRELSQKLDLSLGSVNILIKKMIKEGLIKMNQVSKRQVFYMLTPNGIIEKAKKTSRYIKVHYNAINQTKEKIKKVLETLHKDYEKIYILIDENVMNQILKASVDEYISKHTNTNIQILNLDSKLEIIDKKDSVLIYLSEDEKHINNYINLENLDTLNLLKLI
ncbi:MAG: winged helix-turn-helix transcriptional regulator [Bacillota bacterium]|nr:winged helix-turn-helix transcriptional regulator [Bacillota bacterium]